MTDETHRPEDRTASRSDVSRRDFVALSMTAGLAVAAGNLTSAAELPVAEVNVNITTPDGVCDAVLLHPTSGAHAAVILWPDAFGLRPSMVTMGKRLAGEGYTVLVPNPFYRVTKAPVFDMSSFSFQDPEDRKTLGSLMGGITAAGAAERDAAAFVAFLDAQKTVDTGRAIGTQGYCMGGPLVMRTAAAIPDRIGAGASFHGGGMVTGQPTSPHLLIPKMKAQIYIGIAANDDAQQPDAKDTLRSAFASANVTATIEVYGSQHGWCVPDMPAEAGSPIYNKPDAEKAWSHLLALYKAALA